MALANQSRHACVGPAWVPVIGALDFGKFNSDQIAGLRTETPVLCSNEIAAFTTTESGTSTENIRALIRRADATTRARIDVMIQPNRFAAMIELLAR